MLKCLFALSSIQFNPQLNRNKKLVMSLHGGSTYLIYMGLFKELQSKSNTNVKPMYLSI